MRIPHLALPAVVAALGMLSASTGVAATITVNSTTDAQVAGNGACTLPEAVANANTDSDTTAGDCAAGSGADEILLSAGTYSTHLVIDSELTLLGAGAEIQNSHIDVASGGDLLVRNIKLISSRIYNEGTLRLRSSSMSALHDGCAIVTYGTVQIVNSTLLDNYYLEVPSDCGIRGGPCLPERVECGISDDPFENYVTYITSSTVSGVYGVEVWKNSIYVWRPDLVTLRDHGGGTLTFALPDFGAYSEHIDAIAPEDCTFDDDLDPQTPEMPLLEDQRGEPRPQGVGDDGIARCDEGAYEKLPACEDRKDNDHDGRIDLADPGCTAPEDSSEGVPLNQWEWRCEVEQRSRGAEFCAAVFDCWSRQVANPAKDPSGARLDACLDKVEGKFASGYQKALRDRRADCRFKEPVEAFVEDAFFEPMASIRDQILAGWTAGVASPDENRFRSDVLAAAGDYCVAPKSPDRAGDFTSQVNRALDKALKKGVPDPGLDTQAIAASINHILIDFGERVRTVP